MAVPMSVTAVLLLLVAVAFTANPVVGQKSVVANVDSLQSCKDDANLPSHITFTKVKRISRVDESFTLHLDLHEPITKGFELYVEQTRCDSKQQSDSCRYMVSINLKDVCKKFYEKKEIWTYFVQEAKGLPNGCPVPSGKYIFHNVTTHIARFVSSLLVTQSGYYIYEIRGMQKKKVMFCCKVEAFVKVKA